MVRKYLFLAAIITILSSVFVQAHCDGIDGPVIKAAQKAIETGNVNYVLIWVKEKGEDELKAAFQKAYKSRHADEKEKNLTENTFFEVLVKLHREAEGEEFTGVKPAGRYAGTVIPLADEAIGKNSMEPLSKKLDDSQLKKLKKYFDAVIKNKNYETNDVAAERKFVSSYVEFFHHLEHLTHSTHNEG